MAVKISFSIESKKLSAAVSSIERNARFAVARALTDTAADIQADVRRTMPQKFVLRRDWIVKGIRITPAKKDSLVAAVYSKDASFMARQETGGDKTPKQGQNLAIPAIGPRGVKRTKAGIIQKSQLPGALGNKAFKVQGRSGKQLLMMRDKRGLRLLYVLQHDARVKPRLGLHSTAEKLAGPRFNRHFGLRWREATAGKGGAGK